MDVVVVGAAVLMAVSEVAGVILAILAAGDWLTVFLAALRDWAAFPVPRDAMIYDFFFNQ